MRITEFRTPVSHRPKLKDRETGFWRTLLNEKADGAEEAEEASVFSDGGGFTSLRENMPFLLLDFPFSFFTDLRTKEDLEQSPTQFASEHPCWKRRQVPYIPTNPNNRLGSPDSQRPVETKQLDPPIR